MNIKGNPYYNYEKVGDKYILYSSGQDGIPETKDDLYPQITINDSSNIGLIKSPWRNATKGNFGFGIIQAQDAYALN